MREFEIVSVYPVSVIRMIPAFAAYVIPSALVSINITKPMVFFIVLEFKVFILPTVSVNRNNFKLNFNLLMGRQVRIRSFGARILAKSAVPAKHTSETPASSVARFPVTHVRRFPSVPRY